MWKNSKRAAITKWLSHVPKRAWFSVIFMVVGTILFFTFVFEEKPYLSCVAVSPDGTEVAATSMNEQRLYVYDCEGRLKWEHAYTADETNGGRSCVMYLRGLVVVYSCREHKLIFFGPTGTKLHEDPTDINYSEDCFSGWEHSGGAYQTTVNGYSYAYYKAYFPVRFAGKERYLSVTGPDGVEHILWSTGIESFMDRSQR